MTDGLAAPAPSKDLSFFSQNDLDPPTDDIETILDRLHRSWTLSPAPYDQPHQPIAPPLPPSSRLGRPQQPPFAPSAMDAFLLSHSHVVKAVGLPSGTTHDEIADWIARSRKGELSGGGGGAGVMATWTERAGEAWIIFDQHENARNSLHLSGFLFRDVEVTILPALRDDLDRLSQKLFPLPVSSSSAQPVNNALNSRFYHSNFTPFTPTLQHQSPAQSSVVLSRMTPPLTPSPSSTLFGTPSLSSMPFPFFPPRTETSVADLAQSYWAPREEDLRQRSPDADRERDVRADLENLNFGLGAGSVGAPVVSFRQGDWICPSDKCSFHNFSRNDRCANCGTGKPRSPHRRATAVSLSPSHSPSHTLPPSSSSSSSALGHQRNHSQPMPPGPAPFSSPSAIGPPSGRRLQSSASNPNFRGGGGGEGGPGGGPGVQRTFGSPDRSLTGAGRLRGGFEVGSTPDQQQQQPFSGSPRPRMFKNSPSQSSLFGPGDRVGEEDEEDQQDQTQAIGLGLALGDSGGTLGGGGFGEGLENGPGLTRSGGFPIKLAEGVELPIGPPPPRSLASLSPILNTGNTGPMTIQQGDWACGACGFINWRRRKVCLRCFPFADGNELSGNSLATSAIMAAQLARYPASSIQPGFGPSVPEPEPISTSSPRAPPVVFPPFSPVPPTQQNHALSSPSLSRQPSYQPLTSSPSPALHVPSHSSPDQRPRQHQEQSRPSSTFSSPSSSSPPQYDAFGRIEFISPPLGTGTGASVWAPTSEERQGGTTRLGMRQAKSWKRVAPGSQTGAEVEKGVAGGGAREQEGGEGH